ncbi:MAG: hypothetical protein JNJ89_00330 [Rubrivivax sp.]|nr:hypothetical protein [Rubrivivax sp.]
MTQIAIQMPAAVAMPRGAVWAASFFSALAQAIHTLWTSRSPSDPALARGRQAAEVRRYASQVSLTDPGFAADLFAAADRFIDAGERR